jgi:hypothetical protein
MTEPFTFCRIRNREAAGYLTKLSLLIAWRVSPANFSCGGFCELRTEGVLASSPSFDGYSCERCLR